RLARELLHQHAELDAVHGVPQVGKRECDGGANRPARPGKDRRSHGPVAPARAAGHSRGDAADDCAARSAISLLGALPRALERRTAALARDDTATVHVGVTGLRTVDPTLVIDVDPVALAHPVELSSVCVA